MAEPGRDVCFPDAWWADEEHVGRSLDEPAGGQLLQEVAVDAGGGVEVEVVRVCPVGRFREPEPAHETPRVGGGDFDGEEPLEGLGEGPALGLGLVENGGEGVGGRHLCVEHIYPLLGERKLRDLKAAEVEKWLAGRAQVLSTSSLRSLYGCLNRAVPRAMARHLVRRNVVELVNLPTGRAVRPSKSLTPQDVDDVLTKTAPDRLHHHIVVSLLTGARTEELRALRWEYVHLDGDPGAGLPVPPHMEVWRSVRDGGDTKTKRSRRTLAPPARCAEAFRSQRA